MIDAVDPFATGQIYGAKHQTSGGRALTAGGDQHRSYTFFGKCPGGHIIVGGKDGRNKTLRVKGGEKGEEEEGEDEGRSRFYMLCEIDANRTKLQRSTYDEGITLKRFCEELCVEGENVFMLLKFTENSHIN